jgi:hypothetical protein
VPDNSAGSLPRPLAEVVDSAVGRAHRHDPVAPRTGGPAGNARLTAWLGLIFLVLAIVECVTALGVRQLMTAHILVGAAMLPVVLAKTATTGWRIVRYYTGDDAYRAAGPPPVLLRLVGPLVILTGLAVLGSGLALIALGSRSHDSIATIAGQRIDGVTLHQATFIAWLVVVGVHGLARLVPAWSLTVARRRHAALSGGGLRRAALAGIVAAAVVCGSVTLQFSDDWTHGFAGFPSFQGDDR